MMFRSLPMLLSVALIGCANLSTTPCCIEPPVAQHVLVVPYRMRPVSVAMSNEGASLRRVVSDAYDISSRKGDLTVSHLLNQVRDDSTNNFAGITSEVLKEATFTDVSEPSLIAGRVVILIRGQSRMILHEDLVFQTDVGSIRVLPRDQVVTLPLKSIKDRTLNESDMINANADANYTLQTLGKADMVVKRDTTMQSSDVSQIGNLLNNRPKFDDSELLPNVVIVTRAIDGFVETIILPAVVQVGDQPYSELCDVPRTTDILDGVKLLNQDIVEFTRLELVPIIALGTALPPPIPIGLETSLANCHNDLIQCHAQTAALTGDGRLNTSRIRTSYASLVDLCRPSWNLLRRCAVPPTIP